MKDAHNLTCFCPLCAYRLEDNGDRLADGDTFEPFETIRQQRLLHESEG